MCVMYVGLCVYDVCVIHVRVYVLNTDMYVLLHSVLCVEICGKLHESVLFFHCGFLQGPNSGLQALGERAFTHWAILPPKRIS